MACLLHLSDPHFGTEVAEVTAALREWVRSLRPQVLVLSGDLTQRARPEQFAAARHFCAELDVGLMLFLPGNHDIPLFNVAMRAMRPYANYLREFGPRLEAVLQTDELVVIGVNTTRASRHKNGEVSDAQIEHTSRLLRQSRAGQLRIVVTHHPADVIRAQDRPDRLRGAEAALQAWSAAGGDLVLGGHIHLPYVMDLRARAVPTPRAMWCVQAGTAVSSRVRHGTSNSVNVIRWAPPSAGVARRCEVQRCDYDPQRGEFRLVETRELQLA